VRGHLHDNRRRSGRWRDEARSRFVGHGIREERVRDRADDRGNYGFSEGDQKFEQLFLSVDSDPVVFIIEHVPVSME
jgi:hypothetical protein